MLKLMILFPSSWMIRIRYFKQFITLLNSLVSFTIHQATPSCSNIASSEQEHDPAMTLTILEFAILIFFYHFLLFNQFSFK